MFKEREISRRTMGSPVKTGKRIGAVLGLGLVLSGGVASAQQTSTNPNPSPITFKVWGSAPTLGIQKTPIAEELRKVTGVTLDVVGGDSSKFKVLLAGNDLPDIIFTNYTSQGVDSNTLVSGGSLIPLDSLIEKYGPNIKKNFPKRLDYSKKFLSTGKNAIYYLPVNTYKADPKSQDISFYGANLGYFGRWDIYAKIGYPQPKSFDEFLGVLKRMQEASPKTPDGKKVYALSGWQDWGIWPWFISTMYKFGYYDKQYDMWYGGEKEQALNMLTEDKFWQSIAWFNKAYNLGLLDPEAFTMKYDNYMQKVKAGQVLVTYGSWMVQDANATFAANGHPDQGFQLLPDGLPYVAGLYSADAPIGWGQNYAVAITSNCKDPERAMQFLDYTFSNAGARLLFSGVKGTDWDVIDGRPQMTAEFNEKVQSDKEYKNNRGFGLTFLIGSAGIQLGDDGYPAELTQSREEKAKVVTQVDRDYAAHYGKFAYPGLVVDSWVKAGKVKAVTEFYLTPLLVKDPSDDTKKTISQVDEYLKVAIPKAIMTKSTADFTKAKQKILEDIKKKGYDKASAELLAIYAKAKADAASF